MRLRSLFLLCAWLAAGPALAACPRIVSQSPYLTAALEWLGQGQCIVGVSRYDKHELPKTGGVMDPDADVLAILQPELLVTSDWARPETLAQAVPEGTRTLRLGGFGSIAESEEMLRRLAVSSGRTDAEAQVRRFCRAWQAAARSVGGKGEKVLVLSACSGSPYAFGRQHYIGDAFVRAGFDVVDHAARVRHLREGEEIEDIAAVVARFKPAIVFSLSHESSIACNAALGRVKVRIVSLRGENFFHPGPPLLQGYRELAAGLKS
jgi:iron complex transport system substrate-binding protein